MSLNIKNEETHRLVRQLADRTGESMTEAVTVAVQERLERLGRTEEAVQARFEAIMKISKECGARLTPEQRAFDYNAWLYDENGLPRGD